MAREEIALSASQRRQQRAALDRYLEKQAAVTAIQQRPTPCPITQAAEVVYTAALKTVPVHLTDEDVCSYSFLIKEWCGHCLGHKLDEELEEVVRVNLR